MRRYFVLTTLVLLVLTMVLSPVVWDGARNIFLSVDSGSPHITQFRYIQAFADYPAIVASHLTNNLYVAQFAYSIVYALFPLITLLACWAIVRRRAENLFVWPVIGICLILLPALFRLYSESLLALEFIWPIFLVTLLPATRRDMVIAVSFGLLLLITHPYSAPLLTVAALSALGGRRFARTDARPTRSTAAIVVLFAAIAVIKFVFFRTDYETERTSLTVIIQAFHQYPLALMSLSFLFVASALVMFQRRLRAAWQRRLTLAILICFVATGAILLRFVLDPSAWNNTFYKYLLPFAIGPVFLLAFADRHWQRSSLNDSELSQITLSRQRIIQAAAIVFAAVLLTQTVVWLQLRQHVTQALADNDSACISLRRIPVVNDSILNYVTIGYQTIMMQGRTPNKVALMGDDCDTLLTRGVPNGGVVARPLERPGWFDLSLLQSRAQSERDAKTGQK